VNGGASRFNLSFLTHLNTGCYTHFCNPERRAPDRVAQGEEKMAEVLVDAVHGAIVGVAHNFLIVAGTIILVGLVLVMRSWSHSFTKE
jgi:hypothetical protein